jgi:ABC-2 type transport system ATP-binding protein
MAPALEVVGVSKRFGPRVALDDAHLSVDSGEIVALLGPNGAGKTSLLRVCAGLLTPDSGSVRIEGETMWPRRARRAMSIGTVIDAQHSWYLRLSGRRNLEFFGIAGGMARAAARAAADRRLADAGLAEVSDLAVLAYSSGMRARLAVARARLQEPMVLLLDEPSAGLDDASVERLSELLERERSNTAVVMSTHDRALAGELAGRTVLVDHGRLLDSGVVA